MVVASLPLPSEGENPAQAVVVQTNDSTQPLAASNAASALRLHYTVGPDISIIQKTIKNITNKAGKLKISRVPGKTMLERRPQGRGRRGQVRGQTAAVNK